MAKYYGTIGFVKSIETAPSVWEDEITEKTYYGDFVRDARHWETTEGVNDNVTFNHTISIVADEYATRNFGFIKYAIVAGCRIKVSNIEIHRPRLILTLGGFYNGPVPDQT